MLLSSQESYALLKKYGVPCAETAISKELSALEQASEKMRSPFVLKLSSPDATHKTEAGLVELNICSKEELAKAFGRLLDRAASKALKVDGVVLQEQLKGIEFIVGGKADPTFGQTILFGAGGILVELFKDYSMRVVPITYADADQMISETKASAFLSAGGFRGKSAKREHVLDLLLRVSKLLQENPRIVELDFNPVIANNVGAWVADARMVYE